MNRGRGNFTPRGRGRGGPRASPSFADRRHNSAGAEPSLSGERTWQRKETFTAGKQMSWERKTVPKQAQADASDREFSSPEFNYRAEIVGSDIMQSEESELSSNVHANSSASRERPWQSNERPSGQRHNKSWQGNTGCKQALPVAYEATSAKSVVPEKGCSVDGPLNLDQSLMENLESPCKDPESVGGSENLNKDDSLRENLWKRNERLFGQRHNTPRQGHAGWKQARPVAYEATSAKSDVSEKGSSVDGPLNLDQSLMENLESPSKDPESVGGSENLNKDDSLRENSWKRNGRPCGQRHNTPRQGNTGWKQAQPVAYKATSPQSILPEKGSSVDGPLNLDQSLIGNLETPIEKSCNDSESVGGSENLIKADSSQHLECAAVVEPFDICPPQAGVIKLKSNLLEMNKEKRKQMKQSLEPRTILLRSGMVLLKNYISLAEQVEVVNECRKLGKGKGGFYQPGYRDGAKLSLKMMCLGKNWDPRTSGYGEIRPIDGVKPPPIPINFLELIKRSIKESHTQISKECGSTDKGVEAILPWMSPDICLVNFYTTSGRLGLHQDRDESESSLGKGLPVVSISIGDTAEFLYGDQKDVGKAEKVSLESGDVLIFGGKSRHVFHGVSSIKPNTAPKSLLDMTNLKPGRLNLTFREY